jgi:hypothetical protein
MQLVPQPQPASGARVAELTLYSRPVRTVFDPLGSEEDDITYRASWALAQSEPFARAVLSEAFGDATEEEVARSACSRARQHRAHGRRDRDGTPAPRVGGEACRNVPPAAQLQQYADRDLDRDTIERISASAPRNAAGPECSGSVKPHRS